MEQLLGRGRGRQGGVAQLLGHHLLILVLDILLEYLDVLLAHLHHLLGPKQLVFLHLPGRGGIFLALFH